MRFDGYGRSVVNQEWPLMEDGSSGDTIKPWAVAPFRTMRGGPADDRDRAMLRPFYLDYLKQHGVKAP